MRQAFQRLGRTAAAAMAIVDEQEINSIEVLRFLMDADVETLCHNIKRPGGVAAAPAGGANLGHMISQRAQKNINLEAYWLRHSERISRVCQPADITVVNIWSIRALRDAEDNYEDATPPAIDDKDWPRTMDALREYFRNMYGITKIPLLYAVREQETPMDEPERHWEDPLMQMIDWEHIGSRQQGMLAQFVTQAMWWTTRWSLTSWQRYVACTVAGHISNLSYIGAMVDQPFWP